MPRVAGGPSWRLLILFLAGFVAATASAASAAENGDGSGVTVDWGVLDTPEAAMPVPREASGSTKDEKIVLHRPHRHTAKARHRRARHVAHRKAHGALAHAEGSAVTKAAVTDGAIEPITANSGDADAALLPAVATPVASVKKERARSSGGENLALVAPPPKAPLAAPPPKALATSSGSLRFAAGTAEVPSDGLPMLDAVAERLLADDELRLRLNSYASGGSSEAMQARRISLARAIAVRAYLIEKGVSGTRVELHPLGNGAESGPADRVDLVMLDH